MKTIFFDVDGTLIDGTRGLNEPSIKTRYAFKELFKNHRAIICSGRVMPMLPKEIINLNPKGYLLGNGSYCLINGEELFSFTFDEDDVKKMISFFDENEGIYYIETANKIYTNGIGKPLHEDLVKIWRDETKYNDIKYYVPGLTNMLSFTFKDEDTANKLIKMYYDRYDFVRQFDGMFLYDCNLKSVSKGYGIRKYLELTNTSYEDVFAFGDSYNDLEMMKEVKYSIAMGNSVNKLKEIAYDICDDVLNDGVYYALIKYGLIEPMGDNDND